MCKSCDCSTSGLNPLQIWREMSDDCGHMRRGGHEAGCEIRFCEHGYDPKKAVAFRARELRQVCLIDRCPRMAIELPADSHEISGSYGGEEGVFTVIHGVTKSTAINKTNEYMIGENPDKTYIVHYQGWVPYKGYVIYSVRLQNVTET